MNKKKKCVWLTDTDRQFNKQKEHGWLQLSTKRKRENNNAKT